MKESWRGGGDERTFSVKKSTMTVFCDDEDGVIAPQMISSLVVN